MASFNLEGFQVLTQAYIGKTINSVIFKKVPFLQALVGVGGNQTLSNMKIGRPGVSEVFAGKKLDSARKEVLSGINSYNPITVLDIGDDTKAMGARDTMPTVSAPTTASHDQLGASAKFNWARKTTPILVYNEALFRAQSSAGTGVSNQGKAIANVLQNATDFALNKHIDAWATALWTGAPAVQTADTWSDIAGVTSALSETNVYGNVDRAVAANALWKSNVVSGQAADIAALIDYANYDKECAIVGNGIDLVLTTPALYKTFKAQVRAKGGQILHSGLPEMGQFGFKQECLQYDNTYIMYDPNCPSGNVACLNLSTWTVILGKDANFTTGEFIDLKKYSEGAKDAHQAYIDTRMIVACERPKVNVLFTSVA
jgi:hypothetical protein